MAGARRPARAPGALRGRGVVDRRHAGRARRPVAPRCASDDGERLVGVAAVARHLRRRPRRGAAHGHRARRRRDRARRRRGVPAAELARGGGRVLRAGHGWLRARAHRAHLRSQGGPLHPRSRAGHGPTCRRTGSGTSTTSTSSTATPRPRAAISTCISSSVRPRVAHRRACDASGGTPSTAQHPPAEVHAADPDDVCVLAYTSGTTSDPKGVMHTHRTLLAELDHMRPWILPEFPNLMGSPVAHATGMLGAVLSPMEVGQDIHLIDRWDPGRALEIMLEADIGAGTGASVFLASILDHPGFTPEHAATHAPRRLGRCARAPAARGPARQRTGSRSSARTARRSTPRSPAAPSRTRWRSGTAPTADR